MMFFHIIFQKRFWFMYKKMVEKKVTQGFIIDKEYVLFFTIHKMMCLNTKALREMACEILELKLYHQELNLSLASIF